MSFRALAFLPLFLGLAAGTAFGGTAVPARATPDDMESSVADAFVRASMIIQGLADMTTAAQPYDLAREGAERVRRRLVPEFARRVPPLAVPRALWRGRHIGPMERRTVFAVFQVTVDETSPTGFTVTVISSGFCEEVDVKDRSTQKVLATESLDDEKLFTVSVSGHPLDRNVELSIGVLDPDDSDSLDFAAVPLLDGTGVPLTR